MNIKSLLVLLCLMLSISFVYAGKSEDMPSQIMFVTGEIPGNIDSCGWLHLNLGTYAASTYLEFSEAFGIKNTGSTEIVVASIAIHNTAHLSVRVLPSENIHIAPGAVHWFRLQVYFGEDQMSNCAVQLIPRVI
jgi:hypothetical protein